MVGYGGCRIDFDNWYDDVEGANQLTLSASIAAIENNSNTSLEKDLTEFVKESFYYKEIDDSAEIRSAFVFIGTNICALMTQCKQDRLIDGWIWYDINQKPSVSFSAGWDENDGNCFYDTILPILNSCEPTRIKNSSSLSR